ncbi:MAG TPA: PEP/pyruvate-binding domain-containing protein [Nannocystaceae bacterium]|nr:PEP/pyruvate-binding domain-containing protein [Nannocystaceae bacterium]
MNIGGKAQGLARLRDQDVRVPMGFVVSAGEEPSAATIGALLDEVVARSGCAALAVRSSGTREDGEHRSLAGLFESILNVAPTVEAVLEAIGRCRRSGRSSRAQEAGAAEECPAVLVQEMVRPIWSGVLFTHDPRDGSATPRVELVEGHLGRLVDGSKPDLGVSLTGEGPRALTARIGVEGLAELESLAAAAERAMGGPADIEWAIDSRGALALQARPMTGLAGPAHGTGTVLVPVDRKHAEALPAAVRRHDKVTLRLLADELGIPISTGFVMLCESLEDPAGLTAVAEQIAEWGEFIAVALWPFRWQGKIVRKIGEGAAALACLRGAVDALHGHGGWAAFLLKELQPTARTGVAVRVVDEGRDEIVVDIVHGHFATKGIAGASSYRLAPGGEPRSTRLGVQASMAVVAGGIVRQEPVFGPAELSREEMALIDASVRKLAIHHPRAGIEFGFTPDGEFFLVDLYEGAGVAPSSSRDDVICEGHIVGRVRRIDLDDLAVAASIERHVHDTRAAGADAGTEPTIIVAQRPFHVLDQLVYAARPGTLGMLFEEGALLCHLAVVMREHGVPGLIAPGVREMFVDGDRVALDVRPGVTPTVGRT